MSKQTTLAAKIDNVSLDVRTMDGVTLRKCVIKLAREFDEDLATFLGGEAKRFLASLRCHGADKVVMPIDRIDAKADLVSSTDAISIPALKGCAATCVASKSDQDPPTVKLEFEAIYDDAAWSFLGRNAGGVVQVTLTQRQESLLGERGAA